MPAQRQSDSIKMRQFLETVFEDHEAVFAALEPSLLGSESPLDFKRFEAQDFVGLGLPPATATILVKAITDLVVHQ